MVESLGDPITNISAAVGLVTAVPRSVMPLAPPSPTSWHPEPTTKPVPVTTSENVLEVLLVSAYEAIETLVIVKPCDSVVVVVVGVVEAMKL
jgi:hypothetical protein